MQGQDRMGVDAAACRAAIIESGGRPIPQRDRMACLAKADEWIRLAIDAEREGNRNPPLSARRLKGHQRARTLQQCAAELRELMGPVRRG